MINKIKNVFFLKNIWKLIPLSWRFRIQCLMYSNSFFKFYYSPSNKTFLTVFDKKYKIYTNESPFAYVTYMSCFFDRYIPQPSDYVIDAGGYDGHMAILFAMLCGEEGKVFCFEPDHENYSKIKSNIELNKINNIDLIKKGLWSHSGTIHFFANGTVASSAFYKAPDSSEISIEVISLDELYEKKAFSKINFIKMNIEGSEIEVIKGGNSFFSELRPNFAITADHKVNGSFTYPLVVELLEEIGYKTTLKRVGKGTIAVLNIDSN